MFHIFIGIHLSSSVNLLYLLPQISILLSQHRDFGFVHALSHFLFPALPQKPAWFLAGFSCFLNLYFFLIAISLIYWAAVFSLQDMIRIYASVVSDLDLGFSQHLLMGETFLINSDRHWSLCSLLFNLFIFSYSAKTFRLTCM